MIYQEKHPNWRKKDLQEIEDTRNQLYYFYGLELRGGERVKVDKIIKYLERELNELITDFEHNHECTKAPKASFAESIDGLEKSWNKAGIIS